MPFRLQGEVLNDELYDSSYHLHTGRRRYLQNTGLARDSYYIEPPHFRF
jgi:hypothetical protein